MKQSYLSHNAVSIQHTPSMSVWMGTFVCRYVKRDTVVGRKETFTN